MRAKDGLELGLLAAATVTRTLVRRAVKGPLRPTWTLRTEIAQATMRAVLMRSKGRPPQWLRDTQASLPAQVPLAGEVQFATLALAGVSCEECVPRAARPERTLLYLHGGGYVIGSVAGYRDLASRLAVAANARVVAVEYRLAPEHRFPAQQDDCIAVARALLETGTPPEKLAIAGDSAGAALSVATMCALRDLGLPLPAAAVLICPWVEPFADGGSMVSHDPYDFGDRELLVGWARDTGAPPDDPRFHIPNAKLTNLPPMLVQGGGAEILFDQILRFAEQARAAGVDVELEIATDMFHDWHLQASLLPEGAAALEAAGSFLRRRIPL
jgi:monoterpene epsilon-lactone hydrolase